MKRFVTLLLAIAGVQLAHGQISVIDVTSISQQQIAHAEDIAKWVESIAQLQTQVSQLNQQISLQTDVHNWSGDPVAAGVNVSLGTLGVNVVVQTYGQPQNAILAVANSFASLTNTDQGVYRPITDPGLDGNPVQYDPLTFRQYSVLDAQQQNYQQVVNGTTAQEQDLLADLAATMVALKNATTDAEVLKQSAKITAINGQLAVLSTTRQDQANQVAAQKIANDSRSDEERMAAAQLADKDDYLSNQRITAYMQTIQVRQNQ